LLAPLDQDAMPMAMDGTSYAVAAVSRPLPSPIICFSPLRWQDAHRLRPLMSRFARRREVFFLEEPVQSDAESLLIRPCPQTGVQIVTPMLPACNMEDRRLVLNLLLARSGAAVAWYAMAEAVAFSDHVPWLATVYDCAEGPSIAGLSFEDHLIQSADLVFTGSAALHEDRRARHPNIHCFPDGIDVDHFATARGLLAEPDDQIGLRRPLLGRFGAVDERLDLDLLARIAALRPHWHFALIGQIETTDELPQADNIHWLGARDEAELPPYLCHWDAAIMPLQRWAVAGCRGGTALSGSRAPRDLLADPGDRPALRRPGGCGDRRGCRRLRGGDRAGDAPRGRLGFRGGGRLPGRSVLGHDPRAHGRTARDSRAQRGLFDHADVPTWHLARPRHERARGGRVTSYSSCGDLSGTGRGSLLSCGPRFWFGGRPFSS
jgi:hypothetical protein